MTGRKTVYETIKIENELLSLIKSLEQKKSKGDWIDYIVKEDDSRYGVKDE
jgi:hypothetical protein